MAWKYVIMKVGNTELPVLFPSRMVHALVAESIKDYFVGEAALLSGNMLSVTALETIRKEIKPLSAGECNLIITAAGGSSETLELVSRPEDKDVINAHPYTGGHL